METCGQGFLLPIEEEDSITKVINLYKLWALESKTRPQSINDNFQFFIQVCFALNNEKTLFLIYKFFFRFLF